MPILIIKIWCNIMCSLLLILHTHTSLDLCLKHHPTLKGSLLVTKVNLNVWLFLTGIFPRSLGKLSNGKPDLLNTMNGKVSAFAVMERTWWYYFFLCVSVCGCGWFLSPSILVENWHNSLFLFFLFKAFSIFSFWLVGRLERRRTK